MAVDLFLIAVIICFIIDCSGIVESVKKGISKLVFRKIVNTNFRIKPFDCSLCMTFWICLICAYIRGCLTIPVFAYICLLSHITTTITQLLYVIQDVIGNLLNRVSDKIEQYDSK